MNAGLGDALVLDIGANVGALIITTGPDLTDAEIEISPRGEPGVRSHNVVHARRTGSGTCHTAVFPALPAGDYTVWRDAGQAHGTVTITGAAVTEYTW